MRFEITLFEKRGPELRVFNSGYLISIHNGQLKYLKSRIKEYSEWVTRPTAACYGMDCKTIYKEA